MANKFGLAEVAQDVQMVTEVRTSEPINTFYVDGAVNEDNRTSTAILLVRPQVSGETGAPRLKKIASMWSGSFIQDRRVDGAPLIFRIQNSQYLFEYRQFPDEIEGESVVLSDTDTVVSEYKLMDMLISESRRGTLMVRVDFQAMPKLDDYGEVITNKKGQKIGIIISMKITRYAGEVIPRVVLPPKKEAKVAKANKDAFV